jgi:ribonucrease Y
LRRVVIALGFATARRPSVTNSIWALLGLLAGVFVAVVVAYLRERFGGRSLRAQADQLLQQAEIERDRLVRAAEIDAKEKLIRMQEKHEREAKRSRDELTSVEKRLRQRETNVERKIATIDQRERELKRREQTLKDAETKIQNELRAAQAKVGQALGELERVAGLSQDQAREELAQGLEEQVRRDAAGRIKRIEDEAKREAHDRATRIVASAIQRFAGGYVAEKTVSVVELPNDEMKGRIIGREGRNIRAIEAATGVDIVIDDTPEVVVVSAFNPIRRETARLALERLVVDGRIHPARIEEVVEQAKQELEESILRHGEQATFDLGLHGMHPELIKLVGKLRYRTANGQNLWNHSVETAALAGLIAEELGLDATHARRAGLLHDIGKAVDHETPGPHWRISAEQARRYGERDAVVEALGYYRDDEASSVLAVVVHVADGLSKSRPGARRDLLETYIKRLSELERISMSFEGVEKAYVLQAGREVRVMVDYKRVSDGDAFMLSNDIAKRIQDNLTYPGEVRVTVVRESRATEIAK